MSYRCDVTVVTRVALLCPGNHIKGRGVGLNETDTQTDRVRERGEGGGRGREEILFSEYSGFWMLGVNQSHLPGRMNKRKIDLLV
jgi:hypothetical protein